MANTFGIKSITIYNLQNEKLPEYIKRKFETTIFNFDHDKTA